MHTFGRPSPAEQSDISRSIAMRRLTQLLQANPGNPQKAMLDFFSSDEGQQALVDDHDKTLLPSIEALIKGTSTGDREVAAGSSLVGQDTQGNYTTKYTAPGQPTEAEKVTNAIILAEKNGDTKQADLLRRYLPRDKDAQTTVDAALKMRAAGVDTTGNDVVDAISPKDAQNAIEIGRSPQEKEVSMTDVLIRATGAKTGNPRADALSPQAAEATAKFYKETHGAENLINAILGNLGGAGGAALPGGGAEAPSAAAKFRAQQEGGTAAPEAPPAPPSVGGPNAAGNGPQVYTDAQLQALSGGELDRVYTGARSGAISMTPPQVAILAGRYRALGRKPPTAAAPPGP